MDLRSTYRRFVACSIFLIRFSRTSTLRSLRGLSNLRRSKDLQDKGIGLYRISHSGRFNIRARANRGRLSLLNDHILNFIRGGCNVVRHASARRDR